MPEPLQPGRQDDSTQDLPALREGLSSLYSRSIEVPAALDEAIRREIRGHFIPKSRRHSRQWRVMPWVAAALITLTVIVWPMLHRGVSTQRPVARIEPADIDHSGRIDILDAFSLARRIESGQSIDASVDLNHDGKVDGLDVNLIASKAVALNPGGSGAG